MDDAGPPRSSILREIHMGLFAPLFLHTVLIHVAIVIARVTTSYKIVELGMSLVWVGVITAGFALIPVFVAVPLGRFIDKGHDSLVVRVGSLLLVVSALGFWLIPPGAASLFLATVVLGVGQLACMAGHQMISIRTGRTTRGRDAVFGYHMVAIALGQGLGPLIIGWVAGDARVPPTAPLCGIGAAFTIVALVVTLALPPAPAGTAKGHGGSSAGIADLLRIRGLMAYVMASVITVTALDLIVVYMPLLGAERHIDVATVGYLMAVRAISSM